MITITTTINIIFIIIIIIIIISDALCAWADGGDELLRHVVLHGPRADPAPHRAPPAAHLRTRRGLVSARGGQCILGTEPRALAAGLNQYRQVFLL
jgi:hypothetical protein